ncbi:MAG: hypothetical protein OEW52_10575 [Thermoleophilia bacterium]|nr:hypothetical protein [Thermoleophilia bacterium]
MNVRNVVLRLSGWPRLGNRPALLGDRAALHEECPEMGQRRLVAVGCRNGHGQAVGGNRSGEHDDSTHWGTHHVHAAESDIHTSMLPARVLVTRDRELAKNIAVGGPCPR